MLMPKARHTPKTSKYTEKSSQHPVAKQQKINDPE